MGQFKDSEGRKWDIVATVHTLRRVKQETADKENGFEGIDLTKAETITTLGDDVFVLGAVLYSLCQDQMDKHNLDEDQFAHGLADGDVIQDAVDCLVNELVNFTRPATKRQALKKMLAKRAEFLDKTMDAQNEVMDGPLLDNSLENEMNNLKDELEQQYGTTSTPTPESSESTLNP